MPKSPSEIWESLLQITKETQNKIPDLDLVLSAQIRQVKRSYDSSQLELIEEAAYKIIELLEPYQEEVRERIMTLFITP